MHPFSDSFAGLGPHMYRSTGDRGLGLPVGATDERRRADPDPDPDPDPDRKVVGGRARAFTEAAAIASCYACGRTARHRRTWVNVQLERTDARDDPDGTDFTTRTVEVPVPRCGDCQAVERPHQARVRAYRGAQGTIRAVVQVVVMLAAAITAGLVAWRAGENPPLAVALAGVFAYVPGLFAGVGVGWLAGVGRRPSSVPHHDELTSYPAIADLRSQKWTVRQQHDLIAPECDRSTST